MTKDSALLSRFGALARTVLPGGELQRVERLTGGVSATLHALEIATPSGLRHVVVREFDAGDWKPRQQGVAAKEFALLKWLRRCGLPVPAPLHLDETGELFPGPLLVMERVDGTSDVPEDARTGALRQMAQFLARLHRLEVSDLEIVRVYREVRVDEHPVARAREHGSVDSVGSDDSRELVDCGVIRRNRRAAPESAVSRLLPALDDPLAGCQQYLPNDPLGAELRSHLAGLPRFRSRNPPTLVHGDFWPGNVLWCDRRLAAVIDWEDAALGDPLCDVACSRVELLCRYDASATELFTEHYRTLTTHDWRDLPLWEVYVSAAALATMARWGLSPEEEARRRRRTREFFEAAARQLLRTKI